MRVRLRVRPASRLRTPIQHCRWSANSLRSSMLARVATEAGTMFIFAVVNPARQFTTLLTYRFGDRSRR